MRSSWRGGRRDVPCVSQPAWTAGCHRNRQRGPEAGRGGTGRGGEGERGEGERGNREAIRACSRGALFEQCISATITACAERQVHLLSGESEERLRDAPQQARNDGDGVWPE